MCAPLVFSYFSHWLDIVGTPSGSLLRHMTRRKFPLNSIWTWDLQLPTSFPKLPSSQGGITGYSRITNAFRYISTIYREADSASVLTSPLPDAFFFFISGADLPQRVWTRSISSWPPDCQLHVHWPVTDCHIAPSRPTEPRGPPLWTPCLDLLHLLELFNSPPCAQSCSYPWYLLSWAPLCQSLWIPVLLRNVIIVSCWHISHEIWSHPVMKYRKLGQMRLFFLEGLKKKKEVLARVDMIFTSPLFSNSVFSITSYYKQLYKYYSKTKGLLVNTSERSAPW